LADWITSLLLVSSFHLFETSQQINIWQHITHLGSANVLMPMIALTVVALWQAYQKLAVGIFMFILLAAIIITLISKIIFLGWGIGIASLDFTGISGHTLLATSVFPILFSWMMSPIHGKFRYSGELVGLLLALVVGLSRIVVGAHSLSEVVAGWLLGLIVCGITLNAIERPTNIPHFFRYITLSFLLMINLTSINYLPSHDWEVKLALLLSGHNASYTRQHLASKLHIYLNNSGITY
jgi:membrane-associated phospholipid phosphatase